MISRLQIFLSVLLSVLLLFGCKASNKATVSYDSSVNRTTYQTRSYTVSTFSGANFASSKEITMQTIARCQGAKCTPSKVQLVFSAMGTQELSLSGVDGEIVADGNRISWSNSEARSGLGGAVEEQVLKVSGKFAVVDLQLGQLETLAMAESVEGSIGGQPLDISSGVQSGFQDLLRNIPEE